MSKQAIESNTHTVKRGVIFHVDPELLVYDAPEDHPLHESDRGRVTVLDEDLILSIIANGVTEPVAVTVEADEEGEKSYLVVDGRRRVFNAIEANKRLKKLAEPEHLVPVIVAKGDENKLSELMIAANEIRKGHSLMVKAEKAAKMLERTKDPARVARAFGVTRPTITLWSKLATLSNAVRKHVEAGRISPTTAVQFASLSPTDQAKAVGEFLAKAAEEGVKPTQRRAEAATRNKREGREPSTLPSKKHLKALVTREDLINRLDPLVVKTIKWLLGDGSPKTIEGLNGALMALAQEAKDKKAAKAEKSAAAS